jgi:hypothetical protein
MKKGKSRIRGMSRRGVESDRSPRVARGRGKRPAEPTVCERCGAVYVRRTWRGDRPLTHARLARAAWAVCPACEQARRGQYFGRVLIGGAFAAENEAAIRRRVRNVAGRARFTQPERRVVATGREGDVLEILTTSQKLAHRIVHELLKAFRGRARYVWSDRDGSLFASWRRDDVRAD